MIPPPPGDIRGDSAERICFPWTSSQSQRGWERRNGPGDGGGLTAVLGERREKLWKAGRNWRRHSLGRVHTWLPGHTVPLRAKKTIFLLGLVGESMSSRLCSDRTDKGQKRPDHLLGIKERDGMEVGRCATSGRKGRRSMFADLESQAKYLMFLTET